MIKRFVAGDVAGDNEGVSKSPGVSLMVGDYQRIIAVVGRMIGWCERIARPPDAEHLRTRMAVGFLFGNTQLSLELWNVIAGGRV